MANELKSYQSQVNAYQFEIERIDKEILNTKKKWFQMRRREMQRMGNGEVIPEEDEGQDMGDEMDMQNGEMHHHQQHQN